MRRGVLAAVALLLLTLGAALPSLAAGAPATARPTQSPATAALLRAAANPAAWTQSAEFVSKDVKSGDEFAFSVAISGTTALVGAREKNSEFGAAYVYVQSGGNWTQQAEITPTDGSYGEEFGWAVALSGNTAIIGAPGQNNATGAAYIYLRTGSTWKQQTKLTDTKAITNANFGESVALVGDTALVGEPYGTSSAFVYNRTGTTWKEQTTLRSTKAGAGDNATWSIVFDGTTAVIGAYAENSARGAAWVFALKGATWKSQGELQASDGVAGDNFGTGLAVQGKTIVVGAPYQNSQTGAVYVFTWNGKTWKQMKELHAGDQKAEVQFGWSIALVAKTLLVGCYGYDFGTGVVYGFTGSGKTWKQTAQIFSGDGTFYDYFGHAIAYDGKNLLVGSWAFKNQAGRAYIFKP